MKKYIKPSIQTIRVNFLPLMAGSNTVSKVTGLDGVDTSNDEFSGGTSDSRRNGFWEDEYE